MQRSFAFLTAALLATPAFASPYAGFDFDDITNWVGSGDNRAGFVVDSTSVGGTVAIWGYRWSDAETPTGADMFFDIAGSVTGALVQTGADPRLGVDVAFYTGLGYAVNSITFEGDTVANDFSGPPYPYWAYYNSDDTAAAVDPWGYASGGMSGRTLTDGDWDGWSYAADGIGAAPTVPEPASLAAIGLVVVALRRRRA